jgi:hyperosmotically inducible protein
LTIVAAGVGCSSRRPVATQMDDKSISAAVKSRLTSDPDVKATEIDVDTINAEVRLSGTVGTEAERREAEKLARNTEGVRMVKNELKVGEPTAGEVITDAWIVSKVKTKLAADPDIRAFNIDVDAVQGVVTLSGVVKTTKARVEAEEHARNTDGVKRVVNEIEVEQG